MGVRNTVTREEAGGMVRREEKDMGESEGEDRKKKGRDKEAGGGGDGGTEWWENLSMEG